MRDGGKGDSRRPLGIPMEEFDNNWDNIFKKKEEPRILGIPVSKLNLDELLKAKDDSRD